MNQEAKEVAHEANDDNNGLFKLIADVFIPLINIRNESLAKARASEGEDVHLKSMCKTARKNVRDAVEVAKGKSVEHLSKR